MYALKASAKEIPENRANYSMEAKTMEKNAYAHIGWPGQEIERFEIPWDGEIPEFDSVCLKGPAVDNDKNRYLKSVRREAPGDVTEVAVSDGRLRVSVIPVTARADFMLSIGSLQFARDEFTIHTRTADDRFERLEEGRVLYRLYSPDTKGPRPLILFLHGGGNGGYEGERDNNKHIVADYGPVNFAENYPHSGPGFCPHPPGVPFFRNLQLDICNCHRNPCSVCSGLSAQQGADSPLHLLRIHKRTGPYICINIYHQGAALGAVSSVVVQKSPLFT